MLFTSLYILFPLNFLNLPDLEDKYKWTQIANFSFDLGLQTSEEISIKNVHFHNFVEACFSFKAKVVKQEKIAEIQKTGNIFRVLVFLEMTDEQEIEDVRQRLKNLKPDLFE